MNALLRGASRAMGAAPPLVGWAGAALAGLVDEAEAGAGAGAAPLLPPVVGLADPQAELVNIVAMLLAVSFSMLAAGYLFDGPLTQPPPLPPGRPCDG